MVEQGAGFLQNIAEDDEEEDVERGEGSRTENESLQEPEKSVVTMAAAARGAEKTGESSEGCNVELKKDIDTVAKITGFSVGESEVDEFGDTAARQEERYRYALLNRQSTSTCDVAEVCRATAQAARKAAQSCRITAEATLNPATVGKNRVEAAARQAVSTLNYPDSRYYRTLVDKYNSTIKSARKRIRNVKIAAEMADDSAAAAETAAEALSGVRDEISLEEGARLLKAHYATSSANMAIHTAFKFEFQALWALKKCWKHIDDAENMRTISEYWRRQLRACWQNCGASETLLTVAHIISILLGCAFLVTLQYYKFSTEAFYSILSVGAIMMIWPVIHNLFKLCVCFRKLQVRGNETRAIIGVIENRLQELSLYFENNSLDFPSSESEKE